MRIVQLMASPFFGGPERQMVGLAENLPGDCRTIFLTFAERGRSGALLDELKRRGLEGHALEKNYPDIPGSVREISHRLRELRADVVCCNGYKPDILGLLAGRQVGIPVVSVSHGWTAATWKVRLNETLDRLVLPWMDAIVCVSKAQADKVRQTGIASERIAVIHNAIDTETVPQFDESIRKELEGQFGERPKWLIGSAGRLSREKGMDQFVKAACRILVRHPAAGFIVFGEGPERNFLEEQIRRHDLQKKFILAGFRSDATKCLACLDVAVLPSWTEGLPVMVLEALAAGVPVVATAVGGTPEVIDDGSTGFLTPAGNPEALADRIVDLLQDEERRRDMGQRGRQKVREQFSCSQQAAAYRRLFEQLMRPLSHDAEKSRARSKRQQASLAMAPMHLKNASCALHHQAQWNSMPLTQDVVDRLLRARLFGT